MSKNKNRNIFLSNQVYHNYLIRLQNLAYTMFEWENVPETVNVRYLEKTLHEKGQVVFFHDEMLGYACLHGASTGLNIYSEPSGYVINTNLGNSFKRNMTNSVAIFNNPLRHPTIPTLQLFAERLYECEVTIGVNIKAQKTPVLITGTRQQQLTLENLYAQFDGNAPVIFGDKGMDECVGVLRTDAPYVGDKITLLKHDIWNECLTFLGLHTSNTDKKERMTADESTANNQHADINALIMLKERQQACEQINKMFGLNMSVKLRVDNINEEGPQEGEQENG